jgi:hypothetical protein
MAGLGRTSPVDRPAPRPIAQHGISVVLPAGWNGVIYRRTPGRGEVTLPVLHAATFPLPPVRGDYGSAAVEIMGSTDVLVALLEFEAASATKALFAGNSRPARLSIPDFSPNSLQRPLPGQAGVQRFFADHGRAFCLYVVLGSFVRRLGLVPAVNQLLAGLAISAPS